MRATFCHIGIAIGLLTFTACSKTEQPTCTSSLSIIAHATISDPCIAEGKIRVTAPLGTGIEYRIGQGAYQATPELGPLRAGQYLLTVKDANGCTVSSNIIIPAVTQGPLFSDVKNLLAANCLGCHSGNNPQAGLNFSENCTIINSWDRIKARAVDGFPTPMPQSGLMLLADRNKIVLWLNAGHRFTD